MRIDRCDIADRQIDTRDIVFEIWSDDALRVGIEGRFGARLYFYRLGDIGVDRRRGRVA